MNRPRFAFLDASHADENTPRNFRRELDADLVEFDATAGHLPDHFDYDGIVITGSSSSAYWDDEWIQNLVSWVAEADERGLPILGVCFGHQVVAAALGGTVEDMDDYELGYSDVERTTNDDADDLLAGISGQFTVFTSHGDYVSELPPGAELLAENGFGVHAFRRDHAFGVQFHPEYDTETAEAIAREKDFLPDEQIQSVLDDITPENYDAACEAKRLFDNFVAYVDRVRTETVESAA
ncbi:type 1 glutamine amidotransferase [Haloferax mediterranei ATCC 33500]|uniref:GMP synthase n=1 Tax=Haloferax mediterranei (strain ATCC 33500 / DSM 1411 / JCM 8866 / NBRC 14739 / NCIMB 2177 / R-4) TaxID=523841 RepID=I3R141_HALMT|nr:type 1 glutamine amidotransferase [Haloferax mediterranei]AFK17951.2 GMP synthase (glutamine-hydrolysing) [Haloferax mediterranei ATCC 33500]AHZ22627.1 glutamine amidotransferase [Haloferax mediterranei ATCC 33500]EMA02771.1 GMP synthase [Haloferax mediterranei ATCC 33500]MDX5988044.1 type 1 glutamine amidotransferase [Haloferax mediterranei ATCC 33500]QCQ76580.1 type 1 glutamine amidotransferase [Haloferax mediterranei ATCC 33500]